jgi:hypothetical protein
MVSGSSRGLRVLGSGRWVLGAGLWKRRMEKGHGKGTRKRDTEEEKGHRKGRGKGGRRRMIGQAQEPEQA